MDSLESDTRPAIVDFLRVRKLEQKVAGLAAMSEADRNVFIEEVFGMVDANGLDRTTYGILTSIGRALGGGGYNRCSCCSVHETCGCHGEV